MVNVFQWYTRTLTPSTYTFPWWRVWGLNLGNILLLRRRVWCAVIFGGDRKGEHVSILPQWRWIFRIIFRAFSLVRRAGRLTLFQETVARCRLSDALPAPDFRTKSAGHHEITTGTVLQLLVLALNGVSRVTIFTNSISLFLCRWCTDLNIVFF